MATLSTFLSDIYGAVGGLAEVADDVLEAVADSRCGLNESVRLWVGDAQAPAGVEPLHLGHAALERALEVARSDGFTAARHLVPNQARRSGRENLIAKSIGFRNARPTCGVERVAAVPVALFHYRVTSVWDERREELLRIAVDTQNAVPFDASLLDRAFLEPGPASDAERGGLDQAWRVARERLPVLVAPRISIYEREAARHLDVERSRLEEYFKSQIRDLDRRLSAAGVDATRCAALTAKRDSVVRDLETRRHDLEDKFKIRVSARLCCLELVDIPRVLVPISLKGRRTGRDLVCSYNFLTHGLDPIPCEGCAQATSAIYLCAAGHLGCPRCEVECGDCRTLSCAACGAVRCAVCEAPTCASCDSACDTCGKVACGRHRGACHAVGVAAASSTLRADNRGVAPSPTPYQSANGRDVVPPLAPHAGANGRGVAPPLAPHASANGRGGAPPLAPHASTNGRGDAPPLAPHASANGRGVAPPLAPHASADGRGVVPPLAPHASANGRGVAPPPAAQRPHAAPMHSHAPVPKPATPPTWSSPSKALFLNAFADFIHQYFELEPELGPIAALVAAGRMKKAATAITELRARLMPTMKPLRERLAQVHGCLTGNPGLIVSRLEKIVHEAMQRLYDEGLPHKQRNSSASAQPASPRGHNGASAPSATPRGQGRPSAPSATPRGQGGPSAPSATSRGRGGPSAPSATPRGQGGPSAPSATPRGQGGPSGQPVTPRGPVAASGAPVCPVHGTPLEPHVAAPCAHQYSSVSDQRNAPGRRTQRLVNSLRHVLPARKAPQDLVDKAAALALQVSPLVDTSEAQIEGWAAAIAYLLPRIDPTVHSIRQTDAAAWFGVSGATVSKRVYDLERALVAQRD